MLSDNNFIKLLFEELIWLDKSWMQRVTQHQFSWKIIANLQVAILSHSSSHVIVHLSGFFVTHPAMDTTTTGKYPKNISEIEILFQNRGKQLSRHFHECHTLIANIGALATTTNIIIHIHINIEYHFFLLRYKSFAGSHMMIYRWHIKNSTNINLKGYSFYQSVTEVLSCFKR